MADFDQSLFFAAFDRVGFLTTATITTNSTTADYQVAFEQPDEALFPNGRKRQYAIRYPQVLLPTLKQDDVVVIGGTHYKVREEPSIDANDSPDGYFRYALLSPT